MRAGDLCRSQRRWRSRSAERTRDRASALILVLWTLVVLSAVALSLGFATHLRVQATAGLSERTRMYFLASGGVARAAADLEARAARGDTPAELRESDTVLYHNVALGEGSYTLLAELDAEGRPVFGIADECARINVNTADPSVLGRAPGLSGNSELLNAVLARRSVRPFGDLNDLLNCEGVTPQVLYGEDANGNGLLDPSENDGDASWPPDNGDGALDGGLAACLTTDSASRNLTAEGRKRVNLNAASAQDLMKSVPGLTQQEADSIVQRRGKSQFTSITDLLDVELVAANSTQQPPAQDQSPKGYATRGRQQSRQQSPGQSDQKAGDGKAPAQQTAQTTGQKAFDTNRFKTMADCVTVSSDEVLKGLVNVNTASETVLRCLPGVSEETARALRRAREQRPRGFESVGDLLDVQGMSVDALRQMVPLITCRSDTFRVRSFGALPNAPGYCCVEAGIDRSAGTARVASWREVE